MPEPLSNPAVFYHPLVTNVKQGAKIDYILGADIQQLLIKRPGVP